MSPLDPLEQVAGSFFHALGSSLSLCSLTGRNIAEPARTLQHFYNTILGNPNILTMFR